MPLRRIQARFADAEAVQGETGVGVLLGFQPERSRIVVDRIEDYADLGPALTVPAVDGLGKVLRILRAGRVAAPAEPLVLVGGQERAAALLRRAVGTLMRLELRSRVRVRFTAWTDEGVEVIDDVADVREFDDAYYVLRRHGRFPVRFERSAVVRQRTKAHRWHEIVGLERA